MQSLQGCSRRCGSSSSSSSSSSSRCCRRHQLRASAGHSMQAGPRLGPSRSGWRRSQIRCRWTRPLWTRLSPWTSLPRLTPSATPASHSQARSTRPSRWTSSPAALPPCHQVWPWCQSRCLILPAWACAPALTRSLLQAAHLPPLDTLPSRGQPACSHLSGVQRPRSRARRHQTHRALPGSRSPECGGLQVGPTFCGSRQVALAGSCIVTPLAQGGKGMQSVSLQLPAVRLGTGC